MGVRVLTDGSDAALYDSVSGFAFGPILDDEGHSAAGEAANCFLAWYQRERVNRPGWGNDLRSLPDADVERIYSEWLTVGAAETHDDICQLCHGTGELLEPQEATS